MSNQGSADSSLDLLLRAQSGDREALEMLFARYLPSLRRWAHGRLPRWARDLADTPDLVQDTLLQTFKRIELFSPERDHALQAYLRQAVMNRIRDEYRRTAARPQRCELDTAAAAPGPSPHVAAVASRLAEDYDAALGRLRLEERELLVGRLELGLSYEELAEATGRPTPNAARSAVVRALVRLAEQMGHEGD
jgi:RNA polymerase sigma-70 factor (ECF subfamily)